MLQNSKFENRALLNGIALTAGYHSMGSRKAAIIRFRTISIGVVFSTH